MTKQQIIEAVKQLNKSVLTEDEIYKIGLMHRELPKQERNWSWLSGLIKWDGSPEALRLFILRRVKRDGDLTKITEEPKTLDEKLEISNEIQILRDERTELNRLMRDEARVERFRRTMADAINNLKALPKIEYKSTSKNNYKEAILMVSDLHIGVEINNYSNTYNLKVAMKRLEKLADDVIRYCKLNEIKKLNVVNLGDLISGIIHPTIRIQQEFDVIEQVVQASELLAHLLYKLQIAAPEIVYRSCTDNHSRVVADKHESIEKESFCRLIDWYLIERLKNTDIKFMNDNLSEDLGKFYLENGKLVMFSHGHLDSPNKSFQHFIGATEEYVHYVLLGHYHQEKTKLFQNMRVFINGSIVGTDDYASTKRLYTKPAQTLLVFDNDNIVNYSINLNIV